MANFVVGLGDEGDGAGLSDTGRTRETMRWQRLDNASMRLSDPCGTSATLLWARPPTQENGAAAAWMWCSSRMAGAHYWDEGD